MRARTLRLLFLLAVLGCVLLYAWHDVSRRHERNEWHRTLDIAFVIVTDGAVDAPALEALRARVPDLGVRLHDELARYRPSAPKPFSFAIYGPAALGVAPPPAPADGLVAAAHHALDLYRFTRNVNRRLAVPSRGFDARVYLVLRPTTDRALVEGMSEHGGRVGVALAELDEETVDTALFVAAHELFHTLGANDRYGPDGRVLLPDGLAEPEREPRYPQRYAEIMARNRAVSLTEEARPSSLAELHVGKLTAREIGWDEQP